MSTEPLGSLFALQNLRSPISTQPVSSTRVLGEIVPLASAASAVATLNVEPVEYRPLVARLNSGEPACSPKSAS
jgi:hypothetical protein